MSEQKIEVRPLHAGDRAAWEGLWDGYLAFYGTSATPELKDLYFQRLLGEDPRDFSGLLAVQGGRPVGLAHYLFHRHGWRAEDVCYLQDLFADPQLRGRGIGRALIEAVYDAADRQGAPSVYWLTQEGNAPARLLYDRIAGRTDFIKYQRVSPG